MQFRQGDVLLQRVEALPAGATPVENKTVAKGEHSNHHHILTGDALLFEDKQTGKLFVQVVSPTGKLEHINTLTGQIAEHLPIEQARGFEPGVYEVIPQKEYNPFTKAAEAVRD